MWRIVHKEAVCDADLEDRICNGQEQAEDTLGTCMQFAVRGMRRADDMSHVRLLYMRVDVSMCLVDS